MPLANPRVRRGLFGSLLLATAGLAVVGCKSSESGDWAQNAPVIEPVDRSANDAERSVYLGAWAEMTASRIDEPRASAEPTTPTIHSVN